MFLFFFNGWMILQPFQRCGFQISTPKIQYETCFKIIQPIISTHHPPAYDMCFFSLGLVSEDFGGSSRFFFRHTTSLHTFFGWHINRSIAERWGSQLGLDEALAWKKNENLEVSGVLSGYPRVLGEKLFLIPAQKFRTYPRGHHSPEKKTSPTPKMKRFPLCLGKW